MGLFGDYDVEDIDADQFAAPTGTWEGQITEVSDYFAEKAGQYKYGFKITKIGTMKSFTQSFTYRGLEGDKLEASLGKLKAFLLRLEFPLKKLERDVAGNKLTQEQAFKILKDYLEGTKVTLTTVKNGEFTNIADWNKAIRLSDNLSPVVHGKTTDKQDEAFDREFDAAMTKVPASDPFDNL